MSLFCKVFPPSQLSLGNIARNVSAQPPSQAAQEATSQAIAAVKEEEQRRQRLFRWALQAEARHILPHERVAECLHVVNPLALGVEVLHTPRQQAAYYKSLIVCGSVWMCPLCAENRGWIVTEYDQVYSCSVSYGIGLCSTQKAHGLQCVQ